MRKTWAVADLVPLLSSVVGCQLEQEECYDSSDLVNSPGLVNLFIQAKRFESMIDMILFPFDGALSGEPLALIDEESFNFTKMSQFSDALVLALADSSEGGESITTGELETLFVGAHLPSNNDIAMFANAWNRSLVFWEDGVYSRSDLPDNYTGAFFDLVYLEELKSSFASSRSSILNEGFAGYGDAWLTAVEGQQLEEAKQLSGVCASVRVQIKQELTMTRIGFEASLEIFNDGAFPLENVTGEQ